MRRAEAEEGGGGGGRRRRRAEPSRCGDIYGGQGGAHVCTHTAPPSALMEHRWSSGDGGAGERAARPSGRVKTSPVQSRL